MAKELIEFSQEQKQIIAKQFFPKGASKEEMVYCMNIAKNMGLNPITKEIFFVPRRSKVGNQWVEKVEPMLGRDSYIKVAHSTGLFAGMKTYSKIETVPNLNNGLWEESSDLIATCEVFRKDTDIPFVVTVRYSEYVQKKQDGTPTKFWKEMPDTMLKKVAESQALRKAFSINGAYSIEEVKDGYDENLPTPQNDPLDNAIDTEVEETVPTKVNINDI